MQKESWGSVDIKCKRGGRTHGLQVSRPYAHGEEEAGGLHDGELEEERVQSTLHTAAGEMNGWKVAGVGLILSSSPSSSLRVLIPFHHQVHVVGPHQAKTRMIK